MKWDLREHGWVGAVLRRCLEYGGSLGLSFLGCGLSLGLVLVLFCIVAFLVGSVPLLIGGTPLISGDMMGDLVLNVVVISAWWGGSAGLIGGLGGIVAGFYSPPGGRDSRFYWCVFNSGRQYFIYGVLGGVGCGIAFSFLISLVWTVRAIGFFSPTIIFSAFLLPIIGQIYGLWRGINLAIQGEVEKKADGI